MRGWKLFAFYLAIMWGVEILDQGMGGALDNLGLPGGLPISEQTAIGLVAHPFLHGNMQHLIGNTTGYIPLGGLICFQEEANFNKVFWFAAIVGGALSSLISPPYAISIGASGVIFGFMGYLIGLSFWGQGLSSTERLVNLCFSGSCLLIVGGALLGMIPGFVPPQVSWQGHLCGFISGLAVAKGVKK